LVLFDHIDHPRCLFLELHFIYRDAMGIFEARLQSDERKKSIYCNAVSL